VEIHGKSGSKIKRLRILMQEPLKIFLVGSGMTFGFWLFVAARASATIVFSLIKEPVAD
jgi:hypothetical protein